MDRIRPSRQDFQWAISNLFFSSVLQNRLQLSENGTTWIRLASALLTAMVVTTTCEHRNSKSNKMRLIGKPWKGGYGYGA